MKPLATERFRAVLRKVRIPAILLVAYVILRGVMAALSDRHGFGSPDGLGPVYLAVAAALMVLRIVLLVVVPAVLTYRAVVFAVTHIARRADATIPAKVSNAPTTSEAVRVPERPPL
ncbi:MULTISPECIES: hypothetical protein [Nocardia]|uniref:hypothetical protein n=1 Tax=Nocardia TaxID=1817 RepID=UPI000D68F76C|nr:MULTISPECIES: hypothetical protein [Nocardia]